MVKIRTCQLEEFHLASKVVNQDGFVHISQRAHRFITDPNTVVQVNQQIKVAVLEIDIPRIRIALSMKAVPNETT